MGVLFVYNFVIYSVLFTERHKCLPFHVIVLLIFYTFFARVVIPNSNDDYVCKRWADGWDPMNTKIWIMWNWWRQKWSMDVFWKLRSILQLKTNWNFYKPQCQKTERNWISSSNLGFQWALSELFVEANRRREPRITEKWSVEQNYWDVITSKTNICRLTANGKCYVHSIQKYFI